MSFTLSVASSASRLTGFSLSVANGAKLNTFGCKEIIGQLPDKSLLTIVVHICKWQKLLIFPTLKNSYFVKDSVSLYIHVYMFI
jgi:hypothetical protein